MFWIIIAIMFSAAFLCLVAILAVGAWAHRNDLKIHRDRDGTLVLTHKSRFEEAKRINDVPPAS